MLGAIETHSPEEIGACLDAGLDPGGRIQGKPLTTWLTEMYTRSERFGACLRELLDRGAALEDPRLAPVLLDDADALRAALARDPDLAHAQVSMRSAFTSLSGASLLHVAAEFACAGAARVLVESGVSPDVRARSDPRGRNGHTPIFHTVNSPRNHALPVLGVLLEAGADTAVRIGALEWGAGFQWSTVFYDVTPAGYAQLGLTPQMHREERDVYRIVSMLFEAAGRPAPDLTNVPNAYAQRSRRR